MSVCSLLGLVHLFICSFVHLFICSFVHLHFGNIVNYRSFLKFDNFVVFIVKIGNVVQSQTTIRSLIRPTRLLEFGMIFL